MNMMISYQELVRTFPKGWDFVAGGGVCVAVTVVSVASLGFFKKFLKIFVVHS